MKQKKTFRILLLETFGPVKQLFRRFILRGFGYKNIHHSVVLERNLNLDRVDPQGITIKKNCLIASGVTILCHEHVYRDLVDKKLPLLKSVEIGERTFVGVGATILPGVTIGNDCIIGAGAIVAKDIPHGSLAVGVPAKVIRSGLIMDDKAVLINVNEGTLPEENVS
jgi:acetyltransferase-like isoleucine patch superfamily enzyme